MLGEPRNYGPTPEEKEEMEKAAAEIKMRREAEERAEREKQEAEEESELKQKQEEWVRKDDVKHTCTSSHTLIAIVKVVRAPELLVSQARHSARSSSMKHIFH